MRGVFGGRLVRAHRKSHERAEQQIERGGFRIDVHPVVGRIHPGLNFPHASGVALISLDRRLHRLIVFLATPALAVSAQQAPPPAPPAQAAPAAAPEQTLPAAPWPTTELIRAYLAQLDAAADLPQPAKDELVKQYQEAVADLAAAAQARTQADAFEADRVAAPKRLLELREELSAPGEEVSPADSTADLPALETQLANLSKELETWRTERDQLTTESSRRTERLTALPGLIAARRNELREIEPASGVVPPAEAAQDLAFAKQVSTASRRQRLGAEIRLLESEQASYTARAELLTARRERADRMTTRLTKRAEELQQRVSARRTEAAQALASETRSQAEELPPALAEASRRNAELADALVSVQVRLGEVTQKQTAIAALRSDLSARMTTVESRVVGVELGPWIGVQLRAELQRMPGLRDLRQSSRELRSEISEIRREQFRTSDALFSLSGDPDGELSRVLEQIDHPGEATKLKAREIVQSRLEALRTLDRASSELLDRIISLDDAVTGAIGSIEQFTAFIEQRILWVRSEEAIGKASLSRLSAEIGVNLDPAAWAALPDAVRDELRARPIRHAIAALVTLVVIGVSGRIRFKSGTNRTQPERGLSIRFTLMRLMTPMLVILPAPVTMLFIAEIFRPIDGGWPFAESIAAMAIALAGMFFVTFFVHGVCRPRGVGELEYRWPNESRRCILRAIRMWMPPAAVVIAGRHYFNHSTGVVGMSEIGRVFLIIWMVGLSWLAFRVIPREGPVMKTFFGGARSGALFQLWPVITVTSVFAPLAIAVAAGLGYSYSAMRLAQRLDWSVTVIIFIAIVRATIRRWLVLQRRRLAVEHLRAAQAKTGDQEQIPSEVVAVSESDSIDLNVVNEQTTRLLRVSLILVVVGALAVIWADLVPALRMVLSVPAPFFGLTIGDLVGAGIVIALTAVIARNLPGLLEITVLRRLPMDAGGRYAISSLLRYLIFVVGTLIAAATLGLQWVQVQWLAAAATVGLGFGLQEIFANFVSGLIILFERPLRVGDTVTIGPLTGTVTRIRIRATTILNWDRKEIIIPNKEFITSHLINWTLSDTTTRLICPVGVAYGSDTALVEKLLYQIAHEIPNLVNELPPLVLFQGFGDSTLNFELRVYIASLDNFISARHEINIRIDNAFREHGIEIAFPQRDLHIRTMPAAFARALHRDREPQPESEQS